MDRLVSMADWLASLPARWFGRAHRLPQQPNQAKFLLMGPEESIRLSKLDEYDAWYEGTASALLNVYTTLNLYYYAANPIYNRNNRNMFWSASAQEKDIKRTHSGFPRDMLNSMADRIGIPTVSSGVQAPQEVHDAIAELQLAGDLGQNLVRKAIPMVFAEGTGAFKPVLDKRVARWPKMEFYPERDIVMIGYSGHVVGIAFKDYYLGDDGTPYTLLDVRHVRFDEAEDEYYSCVDYYLFKGFGSPRAEAAIVPAEDFYAWEDGKRRQRAMGSSAVMVPLNEIEETAGLVPFEAKGVPFPLAVPLVFYPDPNRFGYGTSVYSNKLTIFDDIDQAYSVQSIATRRSTPIEYIDPTYLERDKDGRPIKPKQFDRKYVTFSNASSGIVDGEGRPITSFGIQETHPQVDVQRYMDEIESMKIDALGTFMSPASMGIGISRKDNLGMQREKEKMTIISRNYCIASLIPAIRDMVRCSVALKTYSDSDGANCMVVDPADINVTFDEFASPTLETKANTLVPMLTQNAISPEGFVDEFWGTGKSAEQKAREVNYIYTAKALQMTPNPGNRNYPNADKLEGNRDLGVENGPFMWGVNNPGDRSGDEVNVQNSSSENQPMNPKANPMTEEYAVYDPQ